MGGAPTFHAFTVGTGLIVGPILFDIAYLRETGSYLSIDPVDGNLLNNNVKASRVYASVIYRHPKTTLTVARAAGKPFARSACQVGGGGGVGRIRDHVRPFPRIGRQIVELAATVGPLGESITIGADAAPETRGGAEAERERGLPVLRLSARR